MIKTGKKIIILAVFLALAVAPVSVLAFRTEQLSGVPVAGDFILDQIQTELKLDPGEEIRSSISLTNRSGSDLVFEVSTEDFSVSTIAGRSFDLLGSQAGDYSLKDYLQPETDTFILHHGEKINLPVLINIPAQARPGALYGAVVFSAYPADSDPAGRVVSKLASLFFVRINGEVETGGRLAGFASSKPVYLSGAPIFKFNYQNYGKVYLKPSGELQIKGWSGRPLCQRAITDFFVLPSADYQTETAAPCRLSAGIYRADLRINRGYGDLVDESSFYFAVCPWSYLIVVLILIVLVIFGFWRARVYFKKLSN